MNRLLLLIIVCSSACQQFSSQTASEEDPVISAAQLVLADVLGKNAPAIELINDTSLTADTYIYEASDGRLSVRGSDCIALTRGVYDYLKNNNLGMLDWSGPLFSLPNRWPDAEKVSNTSPFKIRQAFNAVTNAYSTPFWTWARWQQELNWQAMHGFNMLMTPVATEAISSRVWKKLGLTQSEIDSFYTGPAHLPFNRMGCIQQVDGPLPESWAADQIDLQHKILARMRQLGIEPVVESFGGFVPKDLNRLFPNTRFHATNWNEGFPEKQRPAFISPDEPLFEKISKLFMEEWQKEFGNATYYLVDSFNELQLPVTGKPVTELLADYGAKTYDIIRSANPDAIWVIQGWMFSYQRDIWNAETVKALFSKVPDDRVLILDYANDYNNNWEPMNAFNGKQWVYGFVPNMGGKTAYTGDLSLYATGAAKTLSSNQHGNLKGFSLSGEGLENNAVVYELLTDAAWSKSAIDLDEWLPNYCQNRYGGYPAELERSWKLLRKSAYGELVPHPQFGWQLGKAERGTVNNDSAFIESTVAFLNCADSLSNSAGFRADAIERASLTLGLIADKWFNAAADAYKQGNTQRGDSFGEKGLLLLTSLDRIMQSHPLNRLDRWVEMARSHGSTDSLRNYYESNAKYIITVWGPPVNDYSCRVWSGLVRDFYRERMRLVLKGLRNSQPFKSVDWEIAWTKTPGISSVEPFDNPLQRAQQLVTTALTDVAQIAVSDDN